MNKQDIIDWIAGLHIPAPYSAEKFEAMQTEAIAVLKVAPEPKPDFYVGWKGKTRDGREAEIYGKHNRQFYGRVLHGSGRWDEREHGTATAAHPMSPSNDLIPNTPPEPEIWYRGKSQNALFHYASDIHDGYVVEKVEVRVVT